MHASQVEKRLHWLGWIIHGAGVASLLACGLGYHLVVSSLVAQERAHNDDETAHLEELLSSGESTRREHQRLKDEQATLERDAETMRQRIPDQPGEAEFLRQVTQAASEENLRLVNYERGQVAAKPTHSEFEIRLVGEGDYKSICGFIDRLEHLPRVATVQKMSITPADGSSVYPFDLTLLLYYRARGIVENR